MKARLSSAVLIAGAFCASVAVAAFVPVPSIAFGSWQQTSTGAGTVSATSTSIGSLSAVKTNCNGSNHVVTLSFTVATWTPSTATLKVYRGGSSGGETLLASSTVGPINAAGQGSYLDSSADHTDNTAFYKAEVIVGNWDTGISTSEASVGKC